MKEILECLCKSGCSKKLRILLDKIMSARMKAHQDTLRTLDIASRKIRDMQELTPQDEELLLIHTILLENPLKPTSPFQKLLLHFPDCVTHFFDKHVLFINEAIDRKDRIYLDLSLFNAEKHQHESELSLISLLFSKRSYKVLEHPLFDLMAQLKWTKVWWHFHIGLIYQMFFMTLTLAFTLVNFSPKYQDDCHKTAINTILMVASILSLLNAGLKLYGFILKLWRRKKRCHKTYIMENNSDLFELFFITNQAVLPMVALFALGTCAFLCKLNSRIQSFRLRLKRDCSSFVPSKFISAYSQYPNDTQTRGLCIYRRPDSQDCPGFCYFLLTSTHRFCRRLSRPPSRERLLYFSRRQPPQGGCHDHWRAGGQRCRHLLEQHPVQQAHLCLVHHHSHDRGDEHGAWPGYPGHRGAQVIDLKQGTLHYQISAGKLPM